MTDHELKFAREYIDEKLPGGYTITSIEETNDSFYRRIVIHVCPNIIHPVEVKITINHNESTEE